MIENRIIVLQRIILIVRLVKHKIARERIMSRPVINSNIEVPPFFLASIHKNVGQRRFIAEFLKKF